MLTELGLADAMRVAAAVAGRPVKDDEASTDGTVEVVLFRLAEATDRPPLGHRPHRTIDMAGDTIWVVPTERPELMALDRSGKALVKVGWDAGERRIPAGMPEHLWGRAERHPAAADLRVGFDRRVYVQRWTVRDGRLTRGPEWLVFGPAGDLVARLDVPAHWRVLAFGDGSVVAVVSGRNGLMEVRVHALTGAS